MLRPRGSYENSRKIRKNDEKTGKASGGLQSDERSARRQLVGEARVQQMVQRGKWFESETES